jgi:hypothetical protein
MLDASRQMCRHKYATPIDMQPPRKDLAMRTAVKRPSANHRVAMSTTDRDIRDFLAGKSNGEKLLHALYDYVLDEPVPQRLRAMLKR